MAKPDGAHGSLAHGGEGLGQQVVQALAGSVALAELLRLGGQLLIGKRLELRLQRVDLIDFGLVALQLLALAHREQFGEKSHRLRLLSVVGERSWGSAIASLLTTPVAFIGRPRGPPRCKSAPLYHRAQVARPISQGLQGDETPFCALLRPVALSRTVLRPSAPFCAVAPRPLHAPAPSHPGPSRHFFNRCHYFSRRHLARKPTLIQPCSLRGNRLKSTTGQSLLTRCFFFRVVRV